jgi:hypothetical protein
LGNYIYSIGEREYDEFNGIIIKSDTSGNLIWLKRYDDTNRGFLICSTYDNNLMTVFDRSYYNGCVDI